MFIEGRRAVKRISMPGKGELMSKKLESFVAASVFALALPLMGWADHGNSNDDHGHEAIAPAEAAVDFGVLPTGPLGPLPCLQTVGIGGPTDPCAYKQHHLTPEETNIRTGGEVTFQIHNGGHGIAIYPVSTDTTRDQIGQFFCAGIDPHTISDPSKLNCNLSNTNANASHVIKDGDGDIVIVVSPNITNAFPDNRVWYTPDRLVSSGGKQFLNGGTIPAGPTSDGQLITYRFLKPGRYLVTCMNRTNSLNDWMFGFINVTGVDDSGK
jgi:hypothetical protein